MTAEQVITGILINHIDDHFGSIRKTADAHGAGRSPARTDVGRKTEPPLT